MRHGFHYIQLWQWYEQLGILAPVALFWWFGRVARARQWRRLELVCRALIVYDLVYFFAALVVDLPARFESLARLQPLRSLHLLYMLMFLIMGGLLGEYVLKNRVWRWLALFVPLGVGMFIAQRASFSGECARRVARGRSEESVGAGVCLDSRQHAGGCGVCARSRFHADTRGRYDRISLSGAKEPAGGQVKDSGAVSMFPPLGRGMVGAGAGADSVEESSPSGLLALERQIRRELGGGAAAWSCRARLRLPEQRGARLPDSFRVVTAMALFRENPVFGAVDQLQFGTNVYCFGRSSPRPAVSLRKVGISAACAREAIPGEPSLSAYSAEGFS